MKLGNIIKMIPDTIGGGDDIDGVSYGTESSNIFLIVLVSSISYCRGIKSCDANFKVRYGKDAKFR